MLKNVTKTMYQDYLISLKDRGYAKETIVSTHATFLTLAYTGMRVGELCALKWKDVDFEEKSISITKTYWNKTNNTTNYILNTPKTKTSKRVILVNDAIIGELKKLKVMQNEVMSRYQEEYYDGDFIFAKLTNFHGYPEKPGAIRQQLKRLLKLSGLSETLTPHSLRHTHTSLLAEAGVGLTDNSKYLLAYHKKIDQGG